MPKKPVCCAYCGGEVADAEREHAIPKCLYPASKAASKVQRITVPSCAVCNRGWSDDEAHFRNVLLIAGTPNAAVNELWTGKTRRSFTKVDGHRRVRDLAQQMVPTNTPEGPGHMIYPARDARFVRVLAKVIRGLAHYHGVATAVPENRVNVETLTVDMPGAVLDTMNYEHRDADIIDYWYQTFDGEPFQSVWLLRFFEKRIFVGRISTSSDAAPTA
jgi:hypothetical protein